LLVLLPVCLTGIYLIFPDPILRFFGASDEVLPMARDFMRIIMLGSVFGSLSGGMNNFIRAEGFPVWAMSTQVLGALLNGGLNYIFIFRIGMGIRGSALATVLGQLFSTLWVLRFFYSKHSLIRIRLKNFRLQKPIVLSILSIGFAPFMLQMANSAQQMILNKTLFVFGGDLALSAVGILMSVATLLLMPILGICQGAQPLIGFNYGARRFDRVKATLKRAVIAAVCVSTTGWLAIHLWPSWIAGLFTEGHAELVQMSAEAMGIYFAVVFVIGFQIVCAQYFQAVGKALKAAVLTLSRQVLLFIPLLLILPHFWGVDGVWWACPIADALSAALTALVIYSEIKRLPPALPSSN